MDHIRDSLAPRLAAAVASSSLRAVVWRVYGRAGATAGYLLRHGVDAATGGVDIAVLVVGVNDTLRLTSRHRWRQQVRALVEGIGGDLAPAGRIVLVGPPDLRTFEALPQPLRWTLARHADALDHEMCRLAAHDIRILHVPAPPIETPQLLAVDRFHPNAVAYRRWAEHIDAALWHGEPTWWRHALDRAALARPDASPANGQQLRPLR